MKCFCKKDWDGYFYLVILMSIINMLYMHYQILWTIGLEFYIAKTTFLDNFFGVLVDLTLLFLLMLLITWGRIKYSAAATFVLTLLLSFSNVLYSRFFGQYLSYSALGQAGNLNDNVVIQSILSELRVHDLYYLLTFVAFFGVMWLWRRRIVNKKHLTFFASIWMVTLVLIVVTHSIYWYKGSFSRAIQTIFP